MTAPFSTNGITEEEAYETPGRQFRRTQIRFAAQEAAQAVKTAKQRVKALKKEARQAKSDLKQAKKALKKVTKAARAEKAKTAKKRGAPKSAEPSAAKAGRSAKDERPRQSARGQARREEGRQGARDTAKEEGARAAAVARVREPPRLEMATRHGARASGRQTTRRGLPSHLPGVRHERSLSPEVPPDSASARCRPQIARSVVYGPGGCRKNSGKVEVFRPEVFARIRDGDVRGAIPSTRPGRVPIRPQRRRET